MTAKTFCRKCVHRFAEKAGNKSHMGYLAIATIMDTPILLRLATGTCLVFCLLAEWFERYEDR